MKVCLVGSSGGHLTHLYMLKPFWKDKERFWVTFDKEDARSLLEGEKMYPCYYPTNRSLKALIINTKIAVLNKENIHFGKYGSLILLILLETVLIVTIGFCLWRSQIEFIFTYFIIVIGLSGFCCLIDLIRQNTVDKLVMNSHAFATLCEKTNMNENAE